MRDLYSDDYESVAVDGADRLIPDGIRRLTGAAIFIGLIAVMGLWSYRLGTRDAAEVPVIKAAEGPARIEPEDPGGLAGGAPGAGGQRGAGRAAGADAARRRSGRGLSPRRWRPRMRRRASWSLKAPAAMAARVLGEDGALPMPQDMASPDDIARRWTMARCSAPRMPTTPRRSMPPRTPRRRRSPTPSARATGRPIWWWPAPRPLRPRSLRPSTSRRRPPRRPTAAAAPARVEKVAANAGVGARGGRARRRHADGAARRLRQRGDHPAGLGAAGGAERRSARRRRASSCERTTANARVFYRLRVAGFSERRPDAAALRGAEGARHRLHSGDDAVDGAVDGRPRRHPRLRRAGAHGGRAAVLLPRRSLGGSSSSRATSARAKQLARLTARPARQRRARRAGADRPGGRPGGAAARAGLAGVGAGAGGLRAAGGPRSEGAGDVSALPADRRRARARPAST